MEFLIFIQNAVIKKLKIKSHILRFYWLVPILLTASCIQVSSYSLYKNENIDEQDRKQIETLSNGIVQSFQQKDASYIKNICSKYLSEKALDGLSTMVSSITISNVEPNKKVIDEFLVNGSLPNGNQITESDLDGNRYMIKFPVRGANTYISLFTVNDFYTQNKWLLFCVFDKESDVWRLSTLFVCPYEYNNLTAEQLYDSAKILKASQKYIPSLLLAQLAASLANPANQYFHYGNESEIQKFVKRLTEKVQTEYEIPIKEIKTLPQIINIYPQVMLGRFYPMLVYKSSIVLNDTFALKIENDVINKKIDTILPGIKLFGDTILYRATNELLNNGQDVRYYGFVKKSAIDS